MADLYLGLMSGTSLDGVDAVLARLDGGRIEVLAHRHAPFAEPLRAELLALNSPGDNEAHRLALAANGVARSYAALTKTLLASGQHPVEQIRAIGAHGQTVRHRPQEFDACGYTLQVLNGSLLAELTGVDVICDFRSRDLAAGGQGAPLVPAFHRALFGQHADQDVAVLNIGGISNVSLLNAHGSTSGFDCGPGNCLMDMWVSKHLGQAYDAGGGWAASGQVITPLLGAMLADAYFAAPPPRSTGRDLFNQPWLDALLRPYVSARAEDVQATLLELTAASIADCLPKRSGDLIVCGGGALNTQLMARLQARLPSMHVVASDERGLPAMQVEAAAFAWLAKRFLSGQPGSLSAVTGARGPRVLGALYPA